METFHEITFENMKEFDLFLRQSIKAGSILHKRHTTLKYYIKEAVNRELVRKNPYDLFKMPSRKSKEPIWLSEDEIRKIIHWQPVSEKLEKAKNIFIFQIFTGLRYVWAAMRCPELPPLPGSATSLCP
jgi:site-specific recombinase XerD